MPPRTHILCALLALLASLVDAAIDISATPSVGTVGQNDRGTRLDVFAFDVAPRVAPDVRSTVPFKTVTLTGSVVVDDLGTVVNTATTGKNGTLLRARGRLRAPVTANVTNAANETVETVISGGTYWFNVTYGIGGWIALNGGMVASGAGRGSCVGSRSLGSEDVEFEVAAWDDGGNSGWHRMAFLWKPPLASEFVEVPAEYLYAPLSSSCSKTCGGRACRVAADQEVAECFVANSPTESVTSGSLESIFGIDGALYGSSG